MPLLWSPHFPKIMTLLKATEKCKDLTAEISAVLGVPSPQAPVVHVPEGVQRRSTGCSDSPVKPWQGLAPSAKYSPLFLFAARPQGWSMGGITLK